MYHIASDNKSHLCSNWFYDELNSKKDLRFVIKVLTVVDKPFILAWVVVFNVGSVEVVVDVADVVEVDDFFVVSAMR